MQRKRLLGLGLLILIGVAGWVGYRARRHPALPHAQVATSRAGDPAKVLALLNRGEDLKGIDLNNVDPTGNSALMYAVDSHTPAWVQTVLSHGAKPNLENAKGDTALMWAASDHDIETIKLLLAAGADINHKNKDGHSALTYAVVNGNVSTRDPSRKYGSFSIRERQEAIDLLLAAGADVNATDKQGCTPFLFALNDTDVNVNSMLTKGADVRRAIPLTAPTQAVSWTSIGPSGGITDQATPGTTPLMFATLSQRVDLVYKMLALGADVNARDAQGKTALYYAETSKATDAADASKIRARLHQAGARQ